ncbi:MAG: bifunctional phosphoribosylaminoimidazolecarboxamide formyltransferase/IMP cyclohydrolase [Gammaproteobacteria bacterium]
MTEQQTSAGPIRTALLSLWNKEGLDHLARNLQELGIRLLCSDGTAKYLQEKGIHCTPLSELTGFSDLLGGRVKTLHPVIYAGILARPGTDEAELKRQNIEPIDLVICNLYPFTDSLADPKNLESDLIEKIDIGGVSLLRAAAKNFWRTAVAADSTGQNWILDALRTRGADAGLSYELRRRLAARALQITSDYDQHIANWLEPKESDNLDALPETIQWNWKRQSVLRYGENPHQKAALYTRQHSSASESAHATIYEATQIQGKQLSYNNLQDAQTAWDAVCQLDSTGCVAVKHANPCAAATAANLQQAWKKAIRADRTSPFGGIVAFNRRLDSAIAQELLDFGFLEVILAPEFSPGALDLLQQRSNLRLLQPPTPVASAESQPQLQWTGQGNALLVQQCDSVTLGWDHVQQVTQKAPSAQQLKDLELAWKMVGFVKSNAIACAQDQAITAIGAGQMSRVFSVQIAGLKARNANIDLAGHVLASDAFFPFRDNIDEAAALNISAIIQPGGSRRDQEVIAAADEHQIAMLFTGHRHFRH